MKILPALSLAVLLTACSSNTPDLAISQAYEQHCVQGEEGNGPWNNSLELTWMDGEGEVLSEGETLVEAGGVPSLIEDSEGRLIAAFQWFDCEDAETFDKVAVSFSEDQGESWSDPEPIEIANFPEGYQRPFDPTLVLLEDGRIRIYYTSNSKGMSTFGPDTNIYSALSEDGIHYTFEEGERFDLEEDAAFDSAVGYWNGLWHLTTPKNDGVPSSGEAHHGTSEDGLAFEVLDPIQLEEKMNWTGNFLAKADGLYFYGTPGPNSKGNWFTKTEDGETWSPAEIMESSAGDPGVVCIEEDRCLAIGVSMPKPNSTSPVQR